MSERENILSALSAWVRQRPGLEFGNYGDVSAYRSEMRSITKDLHHAETLLAAVAWRESITAADLKAAFRAFSGRLTWDGKKLSYCAGQYWPTEYRKAVCAVLSQALWDYYRDGCMPTPTYQTGDGKKFATEAEAKAHCEAVHKATGSIISLEERYNGMSAGNWLRSTLRREFGRSIASRYFN